MVSKLFPIEPPQSAHETVNQQSTNKYLMSIQSVMLSVQGNIKDMFPVSEGTEAHDTIRNKICSKSWGHSEEICWWSWGLHLQMTEICKSEQKDAHVTRVRDGKNSCAPRAKGPPMPTAVPYRFSYWQWGGQWWLSGSEKGEKWLAPSQQNGRQVNLVFSVPSHVHLPPFSHLGMPISLFTSQGPNHAKKKANLVSVQSQIHT